ncbi:hypothetical protein AGABI1DRAFT_128210 [Agaricus bisporus var. burnettii JB137-S8]|uniref:ATP-dependent DNA helicase n=1 Tax=Agaricus bisporus var. burnettii (strain JB137-S8 / ATCC MYA-4627 / FGSC 10392) TaxID=597362 RepID=K5XBP8_AGABU|nr:uncharacterized protein AGABI1DRAFT_128210 [Agaricus bisporus var. burnettii JB137-S8]EKM80532.1 hypothetical protein AGABI1DRAFT_128210 [Agaricus bisporus var. burnettii JB137-S8]
MEKSRRPQIFYGPIVDRRINGFQISDSIPADNGAFQSGSNDWFPSTELHTDINNVFAGDGIVTSNVDDDEYLSPKDPDTNPLVREIDDVLSAIGWSVDSDIPETSPDVVMDNLFDMPDITIKWKEVVQSRRQEILAARQTQQSSFISSRHVPFREGSENMPESGPLLLLPPSYFMEDYVPPHVSDKDILSQTIRDFKLNTEQRRAFTIVANHSTAIAPKQLLMYLGGMGGTGKTQVLRTLTAFFTSRCQGH